MTSLSTPLPKRPVIRTFTGKELNPLDLKPEDVDIIDIAHALAHVPRFGGQTKRPIYIAQHCVYVFKLCMSQPKPIPLKALLHDAVEAYLGDVTKWVKMSPAMEFFRQCEDAGQAVIDQVFGVPPGEHPAVEWADRVMVRFEGRHVMGFGPAFTIDHPNYPPLTEEELDLVGNWYPWSSMKSKERFLETFYELKWSDQ